MSSIATKLPPRSAQPTQKDSIESHSSFDNSPSHESLLNSSKMLPSPSQSSGSSDFASQSRTSTPNNESTTLAMSGSPLTPQELNSSTLSIKTENSSLAASSHTDNDGHGSGRTFASPVILDSSTAAKQEFNPTTTTRGPQLCHAPSSAFISPPDNYTVVIKNVSNLALVTL